jgi:3-oxoacyl-[acyl-carrier-protein] synthase II
LFGTHCNKLAVSSTKGAHGHLLGAADNLQAVFTVMACYTTWLPPTINVDNPDESVNLNYVPNEKQEWIGGTKRFALKNAFGFGGTNASLCISEYTEK